MGWKKPRAPSVRYLWELKAADAVLEVLRTTRMGCVGIGGMPPEDRGEDEEGEEGGQARPRMYLSFVSLLAVVRRSSPSFVFLCLSLLLVVWEAHYDRLGRSGRKGYSCLTGVPLVCRRKLCHTSTLKRVPHTPTIIPNPTIIARYRTKMHANEQICTLTKKSSIYDRICT